MHNLLGSRHSGLTTSFCKKKSYKSRVRTSGYQTFCRILVTPRNCTVPKGNTRNRLYTNEVVGRKLAINAQLNLKRFDDIPQRHGKIVKLSWYEYGTESQGHGFKSRSRQKMFLYFHVLIIIYYLLIIYYEKRKNNNDHEKI